MNPNRDAFVVSPAPLSVPFVHMLPTQQVDEFLSECVDPILEKHQALLQEKNVDGVNV